MPRTKAMTEIKNARIESTNLGFEGHGIFSYMIFLDYGGSGQGFGGYALGGDYAERTITGILTAVGVDNWEDLKGKYVRVSFGNEAAGFGNKIKAIGNIIEDKWFDPKELADQLEDTKFK